MYSQHFTFCHEYFPLTLNVYLYMIYRVCVCALQIRENVQWYVPWRNSAEHLNRLDQEGLPLQRADFGDTEDQRHLWNQVPLSDWEVRNHLNLLLFNLARYSGRCLLTSVMFSLGVGVWVSQSINQSIIRWNWNYVDLIVDYSCLKAVDENSNTVFNYNQKRRYWFSINYRYISISEDVMENL